MAKIIRSVVECAWRLGNICLHPINEHLHFNEISLSHRKCEPTGEQNFPNNCPLEDGMSMKEHLDSVLAMRIKPCKKK